MACNTILRGLRSFVVSERHFTLLRGSQHFGASLNTGGIIVRVTFCASDCGRSGLGRREAPVAHRLGAECSSARMARRTALCGNSRGKWNMRTAGHTVSSIPRVFRVGLTGGVCEGLTIMATGTRQRITGMRHYPAGILPGECRCALGVAQLASLGRRYVICRHEYRGQAG
jgi:hypothetical protein